MFLDQGSSRATNTVVSLNFTGSFSLNVGTENHDLKIKKERKWRWLLRIRREAFLKEKHVIFVCLCLCLRKQMINEAWVSTYCLFLFSYFFFAYGSTDQGHGGLSDVSRGRQEIFMYLAVMLFERQFKTESIRKLSNFNFQWIKTFYQNNLNKTAFFLQFFKSYRYN